MLWLIILTWLTHDRFSWNLYPGGTTTSSFGFLPLLASSSYNDFVKVKCGFSKVLSFVTADVSGIWTHGDHHAGLTFHNAIIV